MNIRRIALTLVAATALCATACSAGAADAAASVDYSLGPKATVQTLYPDASWLPPEYAKVYPDIAATIENYTLQSLTRDGVKGATVKVTFVPAAGGDQVHVSIRPANAVTRQYAKLHPAFLDAAHAQAALRATSACQAASSPACWAPPPLTEKEKTQPWAFYLPLGMPMATQKTVLFLDYPPSSALLAQDYLKNFTMCRWGRVMGAAGAANPYAYETIVDSRPIAAPGSGEDARLPVPQTWFNSDQGAVYLTPMLQLLTAGSGSTTRPIAIFGGTPRQTWAAMVGASSVKVLDVGTTQLGGQAKKTSWIATNHPDVTTYNCCPGDPSSTCIDKRTNTPSDQLIADEQKDFVAACWMQTMAGAKPPSAAVAKQRCETAWVTAPNSKNKQTLCVQAKLDNQNPDARSKTYEDAWNYCAAHQANACATFDNSYDPAQVKLKLPPVARRPSGWDETCSTH
jgi:hypothetical protein